MTSSTTPIARHHATAKEHLAGVKAARVYHEALAAAHLLDTQNPIKDRPYPAEKQTS